MTTKDMDKKYVLFENILTSINARVITLQDKEIKRNNVIMMIVVDMIIAKMKQKNALFAGLYREKFYGGSYYDSLKVGNPNEFDLDLILYLPVIIEPCVKCSDQPGFVNVEVKEYIKILGRSEAEKTRFEKISGLLDAGNYLSTDKVLRWMEGLFHKALEEIRDEMPVKEANGNATYVDVVIDRAKPSEVIRICAISTKGFPAFTLKLSGTDIDGSEIKLDIDLVPCFAFLKESWPNISGGYKPNPSTTKERFLVVPKKPREEHLVNKPGVDRYWRLSFQEQERELISGQNKKVLKPVCKLLKKLRDKHNHKIASYFIKTVFLWTVENEAEEFWCRPLSVVFMAMLKKYEDHIRLKSIPYYWNKKYNLIGYLSDTTIKDIANMLRNIINQIDRSVDDPLSDPYVIGKYLLSKEHFEQLKSEVKLSKKHEKQFQFATTSNILNSPSIDAVDSPVSTKAPLLNLGFDSQLVQLHRQYSDTLEDKQKRFLSDIMTQINGVSTGAPINNQLLNRLQNIDDKMNLILDKVDKVLEETGATNLRVSNMEARLRELEIENRTLRRRLDQGNSGRLDQGQSTSPIVDSIDYLLGARATTFNPHTQH